MTAVTISASIFTPGGDDGAAKALLTVTPWAGALPLESAGPDGVTFAGSAHYELAEDVDLVIELTPTDLTFCYQIIVSTPEPLHELVRYVSVPDAPGGVDYSDLVDVDPESFSPVVVTPTLRETIEQVILENPATVDPVVLAEAIEEYLLANPPASAPDATTLTKGIVQLAGDLSGTAAAPTVPGLSGKAALVHGHVIADVTGLAGALAALAPLVHTHAQGDVTGLTAALALLAPLASPTFTGDPKAPTPTAADNDTSIATTGFVKAQAYAPLASPSFTGNPLAPTPAPGDNDTSIATTGFVKAALDALIASAPGTLDTLDELAAALADDPNFATTITTALAGKAALASPAFTGVPTAPTAAPGTNTTQLATTAFVAALGALKANLASPAFTGDPTAPTPATADNDTSIATTAFVKAQGYAPLASPAFTGTPTGITKAHVGLGNVDNTSDANKPVSTAQAAADAAVLAAAVPKSLVDAKGDLIVATGVDAVARLAVGADGHIPYADSAQAAGIRWDAPPAGGGGSAPTLWAYDSGDLMPPLAYRTDPTSMYLFDGHVHGCLIRIDEDCSLASARIAIATATGVAGATADLVAYRADTEALVGTFGNVAVDSTGVKTATPGAAIAVTPGFYIIGYRLRASIGISCQVRGYRATGLGQTIRSVDLDYPLESTLAWVVPGTGAAPASLTSYSRASGGPAALAPVIVVGITP